MITFQDMISQLIAYWASRGCVIHQGHDVEVGAGTFNPATFLRCLGPEPYDAVYVEPSRRPSDGRYGENPNRLQLFHQMQVILKPSPPDIMDLYLNSLEAIGLKLSEHDIRFVHDDWENPTIGAWGLGWEVWSDGMEITQFTYFQSVGGLPVKPVCGELTYGLERLAMYLQRVDSVYDLQWNEHLKYGEVFKRNEWEWSHYNFHEATVEMWLRHFNDYEQEAKQLIGKQLPFPAYDFVMKASHAFNLLEARGQLSVTERARYIGRIRHLAKSIAECYLASREKMSFPLLSKAEKERLPHPPPLTPRPIDPTQKEDFLLEIGCEELPATFVPIGMRGLEQKIKHLLEKEGIEFDQILVYGTPRRLAVIVKGLVGGVTEQTKERKGPSLKGAFDEEGKPTKAGIGFFNAVGLQPVMDQPAIRVSDGYLFASIKTPAISTREILAKHLSDTILSIEFPKSMRWGDFTFTFARPIRWLVALYGKEVIPFVIGDVLSDRLSYGHRQMAPAPISLNHPSDYLEKLRANFVLADVDERREAIVRQLPPHTIAHDRVMPQVTHLVEYPFVIVGTFDPQFLRAPKEVLISEMVEHQKYFPICDHKDQLSPKFAIVSNQQPSDLIRHGHERALSPRLSDGVFLFGEDLKTPLTTLNERLKRMTYHAPLGSLWAKVERIGAIAALLHQSLPLAPLSEVERGATLCKADLPSLLVGEFPELQGKLGKIYAHHQGESPAVATAIDEHWMPRGEGDQLPQSGAGILLSLADKMDNLVCCFALGLKPSSSSDPYALRRQGLAIFKILLEHKLHLNLDQILKQVFALFLTNPELDPKVKKEVETRQAEILEELIEFLIPRLRTVLGDYSFEKDEIEAVLNQDLTSPYDLYLRLEALHAFRQGRDFSDLLEIDTRTKKLLRSQKNWESCSDVKEGLFVHPAEQALFTQLEELKGRFRHEVDDRHYQKAFILLARLKAPVADLFDAVKVIDDDDKIRSNRLALLQGVYNLCEELADFSKLAR